MITGKGDAPAGVLDHRFLIRVIGFQSKINVTISSTNFVRNMIVAAGFATPI